MQPSYHLARDFVIPPVSQAMYALSPRSAPRVFLGNVVNPKGTHISGGTEDDPDSDKPALVSMLRELGRRRA